MNKISKILLAILGACNIVMSMFIPIAVALLLINATKLSGSGATTLIIVAIASTIFRATKVWLD